MLKYKHDIHHVSKFQRRQKMINKIIWKVILMFGGIAGAIFSIPKMYEPYTNLENAKLNLSSAEARNLSQHIIRKYERDITNYGEELFAWGLLLVASWWAHRG